MRWIIALLVAAMMLPLASATEINVRDLNAPIENNVTAADSPGGTLFEIIGWTLGRTASFTTEAADKASGWLGIPPMIVMVFFGIIIIMVFRWKMNTMLFWGLMLAVLVLLGSGAISLPPLV